MQESQQSIDQTSLGLRKSSSKEEFLTNFYNLYEFHDLCRKCVHGELKTLNFRWTAWRMFLGLLTLNDEIEARSTVHNQRVFYKSEFEKFSNIRSNHKLSPEEDNPLSKDTKVRG